MTTSTTARSESHDRVGPPLTPGSRVQDPFLVHAVEQHGADTEPFTILRLGNASGVIRTAPFWVGDQHRIAGIVAGDVVQVIGEVSTYRGRAQLAVSSIRVLPRNTVPSESLMPSVGSTESLWGSIDRWLVDLAPARLRRAVEAFYLDEEFRTAMAGCPASLTGPGAVIGGLLRHTAEVAVVAKTLARIVGAEPGLTVAGALLHDIGKLEAFSWETGFQLNPEGRLAGPAAMGTEMLARRLTGESGPLLSSGELRHLQHMVLVASDTSALEPATLAANALRLAHRACLEAVESSAGLEDRGTESFGGPNRHVR